MALSCQECGNTIFRLVRDVDVDVADTLYAECTECRVLNGAYKARSDD